MTTFLISLDMHTLSENQQGGLQEFSRQVMAKTSLSFVAGGFVCANRRVVKQRAEKISASNLWPLIAFVHTQLPATQLQRFCP